MVKLLHTADIHLDSPLHSLSLRNEEISEKIQLAIRSTLKKIVDIALEKEVSAVLISGDLFDGKQRSAYTAAFLISQLDRLCEKDIEVFYIKGNHDAENPLSVDVNLPSNVRIFDGRGGKHKIQDTNIWIHGVSFSERVAPHSLLPKFQQPVEGEFNIAMLHTSLTGDSGHDPYAPCSVSDLCKMKFDYWALGHIHKRQVYCDNPWVVMPGIPQGRNIGEDGSKSVSLLTVKDRGITVEELNTSCVEFQNLKIDITSIEDEESLRVMVKQRMTTLRQNLISDDVILRVTISGCTALHWNLHRDQDVWQEIIEGFAVEIGHIWIDKIIFNLSDQEEQMAAGDAVAELSSLMKDVSGEESFISNAIEEVRDVFSKLTPDMRKELMPNEEEVNKLTDELARKGVKRMLAVMRGKSD